MSSISSFNERTGSWTGQITADGPFKPEHGRYHLYAALFCPFAHRVLIMRKLKQLEELLPVTIVHWFKGVKDPETGKYPGWHFDANEPGCQADPLFGARYLSEIYFKAKADYKGVYSVPVLWDKKLNTIVNNESADLMRQLSTCFDSLLPPEAHGTYYPSLLSRKIDEWTPRMQAELNTGVYKAGFASSQEAYDGAVKNVFETLDDTEKLMASSDGPFLLGKQLTELDIRTYTTLVRFDPVYATHFKCNARLIRQYPHLHSWLKRLYHLAPQFGGTTNFEHIRKNYYVSHRDVNPKGIIPIGPLPYIHELEDGDQVEGFTTAAAPS